MPPLHPPRAATGERRGPRDAPHAATGERLVPRDSLPPQLRPLFHHQYFNAMQSAVFDLAFGSDTPLVVAAPTGSGKTAVLELALARLWSTQIGDLRPAAVYIAPLKALTTERLNDWAPRFDAALGIKCCELTGDSGDDGTHLYTDDPGCLARIYTTPYLRQSPECAVIARPCLKRRATPAAPDILPGYSPLSSSNI